MNVILAEPGSGSLGKAALICRRRSCERFNVEMTGCLCLSTCL